MSVCKLLCKVLVSPSTQQGHEGYAALICSSHAVPDPRQYQGMTGCLQLSELPVNMSVLCINFLFQGLTISSTLCAFHEYPVEDDCRMTSGKLQGFMHFVYAAQHKQHTSLTACTIQPCKYSHHTLHEPVGFSQGTSSLIYWISQLPVLYFSSDGIFVSPLSKRALL